MASLLRNRNSNRSRADLRQQPLAVDLFRCTSRSKRFFAVHGRRVGGLRSVRWRRWCTPFIHPGPNTQPICRRCCSECLSLPAGPSATCSVGGGGASHFPHHRPQRLVRIEGRECRQPCLRDRGSSCSDLPSFAAFRPRAVHGDVQINLGVISSVPHLHYVPHLPASSRIFPAHLLCASSLRIFSERAALLVGNHLNLVNLQLV